MNHTDKAGLATEAVDETLFEKTILLIGFMGSGKSTVGKQLAKLLNITLTDTDELIERKEEKSISEIFAVRGEGYFRDLETELLRELLAEKDAKQKGRIISVGGGLPLRGENRELMRQLGTVIYLRAKPETVARRLEGDTGRPLLRTSDPFKRISDMMREREEIYTQAAQITIDTDSLTPEEAAGKCADCIVLFSV